jgi:hypothetical protein
MEARYRRDYTGEFVIVNSIWKEGKRTQQREWIPNPIENQHISGRATCIGSNIDRVKFDYKRLERHRGGLLSTLKLQTYGVGDIAQEMFLDFAVEDRPEKLQELLDSKYYEDHVVYTTAKNCILHPGDFYLIPLNPKLLLPTLPVYLAAFDGHQEIFLLGYTKDMTYGSDTWKNQVREVIQSYSGVKFYFVGEPTNIPELWLDCANATAMSIREYVSYCDI